MRSTILSKVLPAVAVVATAGMSTSALAGTLVTTWSYTVTSVFSGAVFEAGGTGSQSTTPTRIAWSDTDGDTSAIGVYTPGASGTVDTTAAGDPNIWALADQYYHDNKVLNTNTKSLEAANLAITIALTPSVPSGSPLSSPLERTFNIRFIETPNDGKGGVCADGGTPHAPGTINAAGCADIFVFAFDDGQFDFVYDGFVYALFIEQQAGDTPVLGPLSAAACAAAKAPAGCFGFLTEEKKLNDVQFVLAIESYGEVPEPAALALFGLGLVGLGAARRRRKVA